MILVVALIGVIVYLANNWPLIVALWGKFPHWAISLIIFAIVAVIGLVMWAVYREIGKLDKAKDEDQFVKMKEAFIQAFEETGLAKKVEDKKQPKDKSKNGKAKQEKSEATKLKSKNK
jgi:flagellar biosynthesis/type III secretory pathway M-ring protein FliF/YscJ